MSKRHQKKRFSKKKGSDLTKRVKKLEDEMEPILKTFEQRIVDMPISIAGVNLANSDVAVGNGGYFLEFGKYCPTTSQSEYTSGAGPTVQQALPQNIRIGDKITLRSMKVKGSVKAALSSAIGDADNQIRLMAVLIPDWSSISAGATAGTILQSVLQNYGSSYTDQAPMYSPYKAYQDLVSGGNTWPLIKYKVLYDRKFNLVNTISAFAGGTGSGGSNSKESWRHDFEINLKFPKGLVLQYDQNVGAGNTNASPALNNIVIVAVSDSSLATHPTINFNTRCRYYDA